MLNKSILFYDSLTWYVFVDLRSHEIGNLLFKDRLWKQKTFTVILRFRFATAVVEKQSSCAPTVPEEKKSNP